MRAFPRLMLVLLAVLGGCLKDNGGGSDTETLSLSGIVYGGDGKPQADALVKLFPSDYNPSRPDASRLRSARTGADGGFRFEGLAGAGPYNLVSQAGPERQTAFAESLRAGPAAETLRLTLARTYFLSMHDSSYAASDSGIVYFPGTDILARCDSRSLSKVDSIPAGLRRIVAESRKGWRRDSLLVITRDSVRIEASEKGFLVIP